MRGIALGAASRRRCRAPGGEGPLRDCAEQAVAGAPVRVRPPDHLRAALGSIEHSAKVISGSQDGDAARCC